MDDFIRLNDTLRIKLKLATSCINRGGQVCFNMKIKIKQLTFCRVLDKTCQSM